MEKGPSSPVHECMYTLTVKYVLSPRARGNQYGDPASAHLHSGSLLLQCAALTGCSVHETAVSCPKSK